MALLKQFDFQRAVVLALGYPDKRTSIGITEQQAAELDALDRELHDDQYQIDREMLDKAVELLTPEQAPRLARRMTSDTGPSGVRDSPG